MSCGRFVLFSLQREQACSSEPSTEVSLQVNNMALFALCLVYSYFYPDFVKDNEFKKSINNNL